MPLLDLLEENDDKKKQGLLPWLDREICENKQITRDPAWIPGLPLLLISEHTVQFRLKCLDQPKGLDWKDMVHFIKMSLESLDKAVYAKVISSLQNAENELDVILNNGFLIRDFI